MNAEEIYKSALRELASEGNEKAKFALALGLSTDETSTEVRPNIVTALKAANCALLDALRHNGICWSRDTDNRIREAQKQLLNAIGFLTR